MFTAPYVRGSDTSEAAAASIVRHLKAMEAAVHAQVWSAKSHGCTDDELEVLTGISHQTVSARRRALVLKRILRDSGHRRATRSGRQAVVWIVGDDDRVFEGSLKKAPSRPNVAELIAAVVEIKGLVERDRPNGYVPSKALQKLGRWLVHLTGQ